MEDFEDEHERPFRSDRLHGIADLTQAFLPRALGFRASTIYAQIAQGFQGGVKRFLASVPFDALSPSETNLAA